MLFSQNFVFGNTYGFLAAILKNVLKLFTLFFLVPFCDIFFYNMLFFNINNLVNDQVIKRKLLKSWPYPKNIGHRTPENRKIAIIQISLHIILWKNSTLQCIDMCSFWDLNHGYTKYRFPGSVARKFAKNECKNQKITLWTDNSYQSTIISCENIL